MRNDILMPLRRLHGWLHEYPAYRANRKILLNTLIPAFRREEALERKYDEFSGAELVITDRLHGMILCAITGTPCIVLGSKSPKVKGCYDWVRDLGYIRFADQISDIPHLYRQIPKETHLYHSERLIPYFQKLKEDLQTYSGGGNCQ